VLTSGRNSHKILDVGLYGWPLLDIASESFGASNIRYLIMYNGAIS
jgi:hypothetical protein